MAITMYGIKNCDTIKKARTWLEKNKIDYDFHDYKTAGVERAQLEAWSKTVGWETLLNRAGTTFRKLPDERKQHLDQRSAVRLMQEQPSLIKRPMLEVDGQWYVGFSPERYQEIFRNRR